MQAFSGWENFYVIVGSSAGALIGLQFVVLTLIAGMPTTRNLRQAGAAFATPSVVQFAVVLVLSALVSAPWTAMGTAAALWGLLGFCGLVYTVVVIRRLRIQKLYRPVFEDWLFHALLPLVSYLLMMASAWEALQGASAALFFVAAAALMLLLIGIHNAWDAITYHVYTLSTPSTTARIEIIDAATPQLVREVRTLFEEYAASIDHDLCFQGFAEELDSLPGKYAPPRGALLLAIANGNPVGCVAMRPTSVDGVAELKRLYVRPAGRGQRLGFTLTQKIIDRARTTGYRSLRLDTLPSMKEAQSLYRQLGFREIPAYTFNPVPGVLYMELDLRSEQPDERKTDG